MIVLKVSLFFSSYLQGDIFHAPKDKMGKKNKLLQKFLPVKLKIMFQSSFPPQFRSITFCCHCKKLIHALHLMLSLPALLHLLLTLYVHFYKAEIKTDRLLDEQQMSHDVENELGY